MIRFFKVAYWGLFFIIAVLLFLWARSKGRPEDEETYFI